MASDLLRYDKMNVNPHGLKLEEEKRTQAQRRLTAGR